MAKLRVQPHGRLQEWVAHENGYFRDEGLDYELRFVAPDDRSESDSAVDLQAGVREGAYELYQEGRGSKGSEPCDVSSACHWAVNQAAASRLGRMWGGGYSVTPSGVYVPPESPVRKPEELARVEIAAGYHSGSHFSTLQALEAFVRPEKVRLRFSGRPMARLEAALARRVDAVSAWGASGYVLEQREFRKILDTTFMVGFLFPTEVDEGDIEKFMNAMKRAQMDIDLAPERYKHYYEKELPPSVLETVDVRRFGVGERIVFLPYTREMYETTRRWLERRELFEEGPSKSSYDSAVRGGGGARN